MLNTIFPISQSPTISVVMATYNGERFIKEAIKSVLDQTYRDFEFIIVDDGSTDCTADIIAAFDDPRIIYFKKTVNSGIADSLNIGITKAKGTYIARMDDDDVCMLNRFEKQIEIFEINNDILLCSSQVLIKKRTPKPLIESLSHDDLKMQLLFHNAIVHPTVMIRKEVLLKHKYNNEKVPSEDYDLWSRLIWEGEFYKIEEPLLFYRYHKTSETSKRRKEQLIKNIDIAKFMFSKHGFTDLTNNEENIKIFASFDYSIYGTKLRGFMNWFRELKQYNENNNIFPIKKFNKMVDARLELYLISFFTNQNNSKKIITFFYVKIAHKWLLIKHYFYKYF